RAGRIFKRGTSQPVARSRAQPGIDAVTSGPAASFARPQPIRFVILAPADRESSVARDGEDPRGQPAAGDQRGGGGSVGASTRAVRSVRGGGVGRDCCRRRGSTRLW